MPAAALGLLVKPAAFAVASAPMLIDATRSDVIQNRDNIILLVFGLGTLALGNEFGLDGFALPPLSPWVLVVFLPLLAWRFLKFGGGAAKHLVALLPWFSPGAYLGVFALGMLFYSIAAMLLRPRPLSIAPPFFLVGMLALCAPLAAGAP